MSRLTCHPGYYDPAWDICSKCEQIVDDCMSKKRQERDRDARIAGALLALSRVMLWAYLDCRYRQLRGNRGKRGRHRLRAELFAGSVYDGRLRLSYPSEEP